MKTLYPVLFQDCFYTMYFDEENKIAYCNREYAGKVYTDYKEQFKTKTALHKFYSEVRQCKRKTQNGGKIYYCLNDLLFGDSWMSEA